MKKVAKIIMMVFIALGVVGVVSVHATPMLKLTDGTTTVTIVDNSADDLLNLIDGAVSWSGSLGIFNFTVTTGITKPLIGSTTLPQLGLNSLDVSNTGTGKLTIMFTETDFGPLASPGLISFAGGSTRGTVSFSTYLDQSNVPFGTGTLLASMGPFTGGFYDEHTTLITPASPFSLTAVAEINHSGSGMTTSFNEGIAPVSAPEPGTLLLLGSGLVGVGVYYRRKRAK